MRETISFIVFRGSLKSSLIVMAMLFSRSLPFPHALMPSALFPCDKKHGFDNSVVNTRREVLRPFSLLCISCCSFKDTTENDESAAGDLLPFCSELMHSPLYYIVNEISFERRMRKNVDDLRIEESECKSSFEPKTPEPLAYRIPYLRLVTLATVIEDCEVDECFLPSEDIELENAPKSLKNMYETAPKEFRFFHILNSLNNGHHNDCCCMGDFDGNGCLQPFSISPYQRQYFQEKIMVTAKESVPLEFKEVQLNKTTGYLTKLTSFAALLEGVSNLNCIAIRLTIVHFEQVISKNAMVDFTYEHIKQGTVNKPWNGVWYFSKESIGIYIQYTYRFASRGGIQLSNSSSCYDKFSDFKNSIFPFWFNLDGDEINNNRFLSMFQRQSDLTHSNGIGFLSKNNLVIQHLSVLIFFHIVIYRNNLLSTHTCDVCYDSSEELILFQLIFHSSDVSDIFLKNSKKETRGILVRIMAPDFISDKDDCVFYERQHRTTIFIFHKKYNYCRNSDILNTFVDKTQNESNNNQLHIQNRQTIKFVKRRYVPTIAKCQCNTDNLKTSIECSIECFVNIILNFKELLQYFIFSIMFSFLKLFLLLLLLLLLGIYQYFNIDHVKQSPEELEKLLNIYCNKISLSVTWFNEKLKSYEIYSFKMQLKDRTHNVKNEFRIPDHDSSFQKKYKYFRCMKSVINSGIPHESQFSLKDTKYPFHSCISLKKDFRESYLLSLGDTRSPSVVHAYPVYKSILDRHFESGVDDSSLEIELLRVGTFSRFIGSDAPSSISLARAGFYYTGESDTVECFHCHSRYRNWKIKDDPLDVHRRISPSCDFINGQASLNVPVPRNGTGAVGGQIPSNQPTDNSHRIPSNQLTDNSQSIKRSSQKESNDTIQANKRVLHLPNGYNSLSHPLTSASHPQETQFPNHFHENSSHYSVPNGFNSDTRHSATARHSTANTGIPLTTARHSTATSNTGIPLTENGYISNSRALNTSNQSDSSNSSHDITNQRQRVLDRKTNAVRFVNTGLVNGIQFMTPNSKHHALQPNVNGQEPTFQPLDLEPLGIVSASPRYPAYAVLSVRMSTFQGWPPTSGQTPRQMATAGFIFAGYSDYTRCFFCGGGLRNWEPEDDPWNEHAKWFPKCVYMRQNKGDNFVQLVHQNVSNRGDLQSIGTNEENGVQNPENNCVVKMSNDAAIRSVQEMGYTLQVIQAAISTLRSDGKEENAYNILDVVLSDDMTNSTASSAQSSNHVTSQEAESSNTGNQSKPQTTGNSNDPTSALAREIDISDVRSLLEENKSLKESRLCKVCLDNEASIAFVPCGHLACCGECAFAMRKCPICREFVEGRVKTWMS